MQKKLNSIGNSLGIIIDKPILDILRIDKNTVLDISTDGESLIIKPVRNGRENRIRDLADKVADNHAEAFEKLAK